MDRESSIVRTRTLSPETGTGDQELRRSEQEVRRSGEATAVVPPLRGARRTDTVRPPDLLLSCKNRTRSQCDSWTLSFAGLKPCATRRIDQGAAVFDLAGTTFSVRCIDDGRAAAAAVPGVDVNAADSMSGSCRFAVTSTRVPRGSVIGVSNQ